MIAILYDETPRHKENFLKLVGKGYYDSLLFHRVIQGFMIQGGDPDSKRAAAGQRLGNGGPGYTIPAEFNPKLIHEKGALSAARLADQMNPEKASSGSQFYIVQGTKQSESHLRIDQEKYNRALQQFFQKPDNQGYRDSINFFMQHRDEKGFQAYLERLQPVVEEQLGTSINREVSPEVIKAYTTIGGTPQLDGDYTVFGKVIQGLDVIDKIAAVQCDPNNRPVEDVRMTISVREMSRRKIEKTYGYNYPEN
ncbi:MAG: peptidylprolyl isomerase [Bacteroidota bacterium]|nr:peptidylprolyl isomerase [Bacteroidota bacterium]